METPISSSRIISQRRLLQRQRLVQLKQQGHLAQHLLRQRLIGLLQAAEVQGTEIPATLANLAEAMEGILLGILWEEITQDMGENAFMGVIDLKVRWTS